MKHRINKVAQRDIDDAKSADDEDTKPAFCGHVERRTSQPERAASETNVYTPEQAFGLDLIVYPIDPRYPF